MIERVKTKELHWIGDAAFQVFLISFLFVFSPFLWQGHKGFSLWDEGSLWYGVQRVLLGEVPILDFMAYDPDRYYWSAAFLGAFGDNGIMSVRISVAIFQFLGLFVGLLLVAQSQNFKSRADIVFWLLSAVIFVVWMIPRHELFDISISIFLIGILTYLVSNPLSKRYFIAGICVGLVAVFGRNHGMYGAAASIGVIAWLNIKNRNAPGFLSGVLIWGLGVAIGFLPILFMAFLIPGFAFAFWESILFLFKQNATNLPLPVPWPWTVNFVAKSFNNAAREFLIGLFFIGTLLFGGLSVLWVLYQKLKERPVSPTLFASAFPALPYAHFAFSRADFGHLAQGIFPTLVGCLAILSNAKSRVKWPLTVALCITSFWAIYVFHPGWQCFIGKDCVSIEVAGSELKIDPVTAGDIALLRQLADQYAPNDQAFIATPLWPGAYALLGRKSPMWEIYALFPRDESFEKKEIERISASRPGFAFIFNLPLDGREELRFKNTHPLINQYILDNFDPVSISQNPTYQIYKSRDVKQ